MASLTADAIARLTPAQKRELIDYLSQFVTAERRAKIEAVLAQRTRYITLVTEDFHFSQNSCAVLRTAEGLGLQDMHIVENTRRFKLNPNVTRGSDKWMTLHQYNKEGRNNTAACVEVLRSQGYKLAATCPYGEAIPPEALPLDGKVALLMGNEQDGLSNYALESADYTVKIAMQGFLESFNVSVSTALCLYSLTRRLKQQQLPWPLSDDEKTQLRLDWLILSNRCSQVLIEQFLKLQG